MKKYTKIYNNNELFSKPAIFNISDVRKENFDIKKPLLNDLRNLLYRHEEYYDNIIKWFDGKVIPGIKNGERIVYIGYLNNEPIASAILKLGDRTKFCHLYVDEISQEDNIGELFFCQMALDAKRIAKEIHFTLPEHLWESKIEFFKSFGFNSTQLSKNQYRAQDKELRCSNDYKTIWLNVINKIPKINSVFNKYHDSMNNGIIMSVKSKYLQKIFNGEKTVELRKKFNFKLKGCKVILYSSLPYQELHGYATIENIERESPNHIWDKYKDNLACDEKDFVEYVDNNDKIFAIKLKDVTSYIAPITLSQLSYLVNSDLKPPQSYYYLRENITWSNAVSLSEFIHNRYHLNIPIK